MDIRAPNVIVKENKGQIEVHLIDFDFCRKARAQNPMNRSLLEYPPEVEVHQNSDMWSVAVMIWKIVSDTISRDQLVTESAFVVKERFEPYRSFLYEFISKCVVDKPEERLSIDGGLDLLKKMDSIEPGLKLLFK
jgi:serine/threonine protein kinase